MASLRIAGIAVATGLAMLAGNGPAAAGGLVSIQHADGTQIRYPGTAVSIVHDTLRLRSPDRAGTLVIGRAACSHQDEVLMCLPTSAALRQDGTSRAIPLTTGTVYYNPTDAPQPLRFTSRVLPPHGILMSLRTERGSTISLDGTVDADGAR